MSQKLKDIHDKLKGIANQQLVHDPALHECIKELEDEINVSFAAASDDEGPGSNHPQDPSGNP